MPVKVAFIGAGSVGFTRTLFRDILTVPELQDTEFAFTDISRRNLDMVTQICQKDIAANKLPATIVATTDRRRALEGASDVINCTRIGGLEAFATDHGAVNVVGLCHGVEGGWHQIDCMLANLHGDERLRGNQARERTQVVWRRHQSPDLVHQGSLQGAAGGECRTPDRF